MISLSPEELAESRFTKFIADIGAEILHADEVSATELHDRYTASLPPFSTNKKNKKHEFPDAIALLSLEKWAEQQGKRIVAVSGDRDWELFAAQSDFIDVVKNLPDGISKLLESTTELEGLIKAYFVRAKESYMAHEDQFILGLLNANTDDITIEGEGNSSYALELTSSDINFSSWTTDDETPDGILIIESTVGMVRASVDLKLEAEIDGEFLLSIWDSFNHESIPLTENTAQVTETLTATAIIDFERLDGGSISLLNVEFEPLNVCVDFGDIEPDPSFYGDDEDRYH